tara:strand:+ start:132 stop:698 length:567 start_codon:yes stop_codon:yes gene_type:complete
MLAEFLSIILRSIKLDKSLYRDNKNFGEASIYFAILIILLGSIISIIPNSSFLNYMNLNFNLGVVKGPTLKAILLSSFIMWILKTTYLYFVGVVLFPNKKTNCNFRKIIILVAFAQSPLLLNFIVINQVFLFFIFISYIWYNITLIIGLNIILNYDNYVKTTLLSLAPQIVFFLYIISIFQSGNGIVS